MPVVIPLKPMAYRRQRVTKAGQVYPDRDYQRWKQEFAMLWRFNTRRKPPTVSPVSLTITILSDSVEVSVNDVADRGLRPRGIRGDIDNYAKAVMDALNGIVYDDDRRVVELVVRFGEDPDEG